MFQSPRNFSGKTGGLFCEPPKSGLLLQSAASRIFHKATSENPWERGRLARIFLKNAGMMPALPAKN